MLKNYILTGLRNLKRNKIYAVLNILGLAMGIGCATVIFKYINYEISYDTHHENYDKIYRIVQESVYPDHVSYDMGGPHPLGPAVREEFPEFIKVVRTHYNYGGQINIKRDGDRGFEKFLLDEGIVFTENEFFEVFSVDWIDGDPSTALTEPNTAVISKSQAIRFYGVDENNVNSVIGRQFNLDNIRDFTIVGVLEDVTDRTNLPFTIYINYEGQKDPVNPYYNGGTYWNSSSSQTNTYVLVKDGFNPEQANTRFVQFVEKYHGEGESEEQRYKLQPFSEIHYDTQYGSYKSTIRREFLLAIGLIGFFLVITACINFINLATAQAANRSKEIGIRKAIGSLSSQLIIQFLMEISVITFIALLISLAISELLFINLESIIGVRLSLDLLTSGETIGFLLIIFVLVSLFSGFYPSILLSRMSAVKALKSKINNKDHAGGLSLRKALVITQFAISQFLIIGTFIISMQMDYFQKKNLGFSKDAIVSTYMPERDINKMERFRQKMSQSPLISGTTFGLATPTGNSNSYSNFNYEPLQSEENYHGSFKAVDESYLELFDIPLLAGRGIREGDSTNVVINRKVADLMGFEDNYVAAIGETLNTGWGGDKKVVGVIENFHTRSLDQELDFIFLIHYPEVFYNISFKISSMDNADQALAHFRSSWENVYPEYVVDYDFLDQQIAERYETEKSISSLMKLFAVISIIIGCLGLYGLISFIALNKTKEIGIRKVMGASVFNILGLFSKEIILLMSIAFIVATPIAYYILDQWLNNYEFHISIGAGVFAISFGITMLIALATISHRTISAALINPARTLKDE